MGAPRWALQLGSDLIRFCRASKKRFDEEDDFKTRARAAVTKLQGGDVDMLASWKLLCDISRKVRENSGLRALTVAYAHHDAKAVVATFTRQHSLHCAKRMRKGVHCRLFRFDRRIDKRLLYARVVSKEDAIVELPKGDVYAGVR